MHIHMYSTCTCIRIITRLIVYALVCVCICMYTNTHVCVHNKHTCTHTRTHAHTHTHTHTGIYPAPLSLSPERPPASLEWPPTADTLSPGPSAANRYQLRRTPHTAAHESGMRTCEPLSRSERPALVSGPGLDRWGTACDAHNSEAVRGRGERVCGEERGGRV